jgi:disulfide bond formation protein DsbB
VMCDRAAWRLFGLSLAAYNAIISLGAVIIALILLMRRRRAA